MSDSHPYPYIEAWAKHHGWDHSLLDAELAAAKLTQAPPTALRQTYDHRWLTILDVKSELLRMDLYHAFQEIMGYAPASGGR